MPNSQPATASVPRIGHPHSPSRDHAHDNAHDIRRADRDVLAWSHLADRFDPPVRHDGQSGALEGILVGVKDVIDVAGMPTRCGSEAMPAHDSVFDAACVSQLRRAGAVLVGKTVTAEFAFRQPGPTRNPRRDGHTPGGSSSGSAAAVAAGMVPLALGTQTGGSIIRPAAFCGVIGFKPSFGGVLRDGLKLTCDSLDTIGWFAADMALAQTAADVLLPYAPDVPAHRFSKVALIPDAADHPVDADARDALLAACARLRGLGVQVVERSRFAHAAELAELHTVIMTYEFSRNLQAIVDSRPSQLSASLRQTVIDGQHLSRAEYTDARRAQRRLRHDWRGIVGADIDAVLTYSAPGAAPAGLQSTGSSAFNRQWSLLGWPCLHLPTSDNALGLPLGVQLVSDFESDHTLLAAGRAWHDHLRVTRDAT